MKRTVRLLFVMLGLMICAPAFSTEPVDVSLISVISNPALYEGKNIRIIGFLHFEFEGDAVYVHQDDSSYSITKNGIAIAVSDKQRSEWWRLNDQYVMIEGQFTSRVKGHMELWSGTVQNITRLSGRGRKARAR